MRFYALYEKLYAGVQLRLDQLKGACDRSAVEFIPLNSSEIDYSNLPKVGRDDLMYNVAAGSTTLESLLLTKEVTTFYVDNPPYTSHAEGSVPLTYIHEKENFKGPRTVFNITTDRSLLQKYVDYLGGFPIVIKKFGSSRGIGTIKIESWQNLISTTDYLSTISDRFMMREFIPARSGCRLIVLGNEVIAAEDFEMNQDDFRNAVDPAQVRYHQRTFPKELLQTAVRAAQVANVEFAGVDFLEDANGDFYLLEANFPTGFSALIETCAVDTPLMMIEYLVKKQQRHKTKFN